MSDKVIYVLSLVDDKYYVGATTENQLEERVSEHRAKKRSAWTNHYPMVKLIAIYRNVDNWTEDIITKQYMRKYGVDNVRGGSFATIRMPRYQHQLLCNEINTSNNVCWRCGRSNHFIADCYAKTHINGYCLGDKPINSSKYIHPSQTKFKNRNWAEVILSSFGDIFTK